MRKVRIAVVALLLSSAVAFAQTADEQKLAEQEFIAGDKAYNLGRFDEAVDHFTKAYEAWPQAEFLYNIAQSYRLGGNCKQAVYFYKRFRSLKEKELSAKKKEEVDKFIKQLAECAAKAETGGNVQPQSLDRPATPTTTTPKTTTTTATTTTPKTTTTTPTTTTPKTTTTTTPTTTTPKTTTATTTTPPATTTTIPAATTPKTTPTTTAQLESPDEEPEEPEGEDVDGVQDQTQVGAATVISARAEGGIALLSGKDLKFPAQPAFALSGGYPLSLGSAILEVGAGFSFTPLPYEAMGEQQQGKMIGVRAQGVGMFPLASKLWLRGELGVGVVMMGGLKMGNPITTDGGAKSSKLLSVRAGVAADYEITKNVVATVQPFALAFSPGGDGIDSLRAIEILLGVGFRK